MVKTKVFVGNLSFKTQEQDLTKEFEAAGKVSTANIISRGSRSLGYGFVEMESEEEARKAVELLDKKVIDGREINVEVAKPREENANNNNGGAPAQRPPRKPRAPRPAGANGAANNGAAGQQQGEGAEGEGARRRRPQRRPRGPRAPRTNADGTPVAEGAAPAGGAAQPRPPRQPRQPRQPKTDAAPRVAAPNTLFVANLPFSVDDAALSQIFAGLNLKAAHVVRKRNTRSKGFGFVEFNNEEDQKKALAAVDKKTVEARELIVKIARTEPAAAAGAAAPGSPAVEKKEATPASPKPATTTA